MAKKLKHNTTKLPTIGNYEKYTLEDLLSYYNYDIVKDNNEYYTLVCQNCNSKEAYAYKNSFVVICNRKNECGFEENLLQKRLEENKRDKPTSPGNTSKKKPIKRDKTDKELFNDIKSSVESLISSYKDCKLDNTFYDTLTGYLKDNDGLFKPQLQSDIADYNSKELFVIIEDKLKPCTEDKKRVLDVFLSHTCLERIQISEKLYKNLKENCYELKVTKEKKDKEGDVQIIEYYEKLSYCIFELPNTFRDKESNTVKHKIVIQDCNRTVTSTIEGKDLIKPDSFKTFVGSSGKFVIRNNYNTHHAEILKYEFDRHSQEIQLLEKKGYNEDEDLFIFDNGIIKNYTFYKANNDITQIDSKLYTTKSKLKNLILNTETPEGGLQRIIDTFFANLGFKAFFGLGWYVSSLFSNAIFELDRYKFFPLLCVFGEKEGGKNTYCRWLSRLYGFQNIEAGNFQTANSRGLIRALAIFPNLMFWLDEYRNNNSSKQASKFDMLRNVYDRIGHLRAETSNDLKIKQVLLNTPLVISGQERPTDNALFSRFVFLELNKKDRNSKAFKSLNELSYNYSYITYQILTHKSFKEKLLNNIEIAFDTLFETIKDDRLCLNYAVCLSGMQTLKEAFGLNFEIDEFVKKLKSEIIEVHNIKTSESEVNRFWEEVVLLHDKGILKEDRHYVIEDDTLYLWFTKAYSEVEKNYNGKELFSRKDILDYIKFQSYYVSHSTNKRINGVTRTCLVIKLFEEIECLSNIKNI